MLGIFRGTKPDVTPAQTIGLLIAGVPVIAKLLAAFEVYSLTVVQQAALTDTLTWAGIVAGALFVSDAALRAARSGAAAKRDAAALLAPAPAGELTTPDGVADAIRALASTNEIRVGFDGGIEVGPEPRGSTIVSSTGVLAGAAEVAEPPDVTPVVPVPTPVEAEPVAGGPISATEGATPLEASNLEQLVTDEEEFGSPPPPSGVPADPDGAR